MLVILGLLTGGILAGRHLIHAAGLQAVVNEYQQYQTAIMAFQLKYNAFPGDMRNATSFWDNTGNGNGNGHLDSHAETFRFWQHLANAGLIAGQYTGVAGSGSSSHNVIGENCPASRMQGNIGWGARPIMADYTGTGSLWEKYPPHNLLRLGAQSSSSILSGNIFTPEDAWHIDLKTDDGKPAGGTVWSRTWSGCTTATDGTDYGADYNLQNGNTACALFLYLP